MNYQIPTSTGGVWYDSVMSAVHRLSLGKTILMSLGGETSWTYRIVPVVFDGAADAADIGSNEIGAMLGRCFSNADENQQAALVVPASSAATMQARSADKLNWLSSVEYFARSNAAPVAAMSAIAGEPEAAASAPPQPAKLKSLLCDLARADQLTGEQVAGEQADILSALASSGLALVAADQGGLLSSPTPVEAAMELMRSAGSSSSLFIICKCAPAENGLNERESVNPVPVNPVHVSVEDVLAFICRDTKLAPVVDGRGVPLPTAHGAFDMHVFRDELTGLEHVALTVGDLSGDEPVLTRLHSECLTGDVFSSRRCDCGEQLETSLQRLIKAGRGVLIYLRQEGRGIGLANKLKAYELQDRGLDTADANLHLGLPIDARNFALASMILTQLSVCKVRLITNNPAKIDVLQRNGVDVVEREILQAASCQHNDHYLRTKRDRMGHLLGA